VEEDSYTTGQAARILKVTDRGVRKMIDRGELEARQDERGRHLILKRAVHAMLEERRSTIPSGAIESGKISAEEAARASEEARELRERVQDLQRQLGRVEGRLELTERTESSMREDWSASGPARRRNAGGRTPSGRGRRSSGGSWRPNAHGASGDGFSEDRCPIRAFRYPAILICADGCCSWTAKI